MICTYIVHYPNDSRVRPYSFRSTHASLCSNLSDEHNESYIERQRVREAIRHADNAWQNLHTVPTPLPKSISYILIQYNCY